MSKKNKKDKKKNKKRTSSAQSSLQRPRRAALNLIFVPSSFPPGPKPMKPADIRAVREGLNASQALFARLLNVSSNAVESWEQGIREPRQATLEASAHRAPESGRTAELTSSAPSIDYFNSGRTVERTV